MRRYDCLKVIAPLIGDSLVVTNLANTAAEWRSIRPHEGTLYSVGMGMVTPPYAIGIAMWHCPTARSLLRFGWPKLTAHQRQEAFQRLANGETQADIAHTYAAHPATIGHVGE
jgi:hypothetical protein